ncbi:hypothetical protein WB91_08725 [bacteria symbiont BFo1 of Frankliniella occidentalis]|nr:hypothetical protein WB91_08725 [bacteria symbiont BFo1 of Frankliniella occidentalis]CAH0298859.1 hypothetical protein SRABI13_04315 [Erwinia aphidicola]
MISLFYAARGLWRVAANYVRGSLIKTMRVVCDYLIVLISLAVAIFALSGFMFLVIKMLAIMLHSEAQEPVPGYIASAIDSLDQTLSEMTYFKIAVPVFCVVALPSLFGLVGVNWKKIAARWHRLVEVGKDKN